MIDRRTVLLSAIFSVPALRAWPQTGGRGQPLSNTEISSQLAQQVDVVRVSTGVVAGMIDNDGRRLVPHGRSDAPDNLPLNGDTVFDIGSVTKVFTALVLADMVARREVAMNDPVEKYLPPDVHIATFEGKAVRLVDIATYAPGLPGWPDNMQTLNAEKPFPDYTVEQLYGALNGHKLEYAPGTHYVYSNFGFGLLGHVLALRAGLSFEDLVIARICNPLGMHSTRISMTPSMRSRLTPGHDAKLQQVANWNLPPTLAGAGAFRSTANDMLIFLEACTGRTKTVLRPALDAMLKAHRPADKPGLSAAAGWFVSTDHNDELVWKDGATAGYSTFVGYSTRSRVCAILLANGQCGNVITPLGKHLINADFPFAQTKR